MASLEEYLFYPIQLRNGSDLHLAWKLALPFLLMMCLQIDTLSLAKHCFDPAKTESSLQSGSVLNKQSDV